MRIFVYFIFAQLTNSALFLSPLLLLLFFCLHCVSLFSFIVLFCLLPCPDIFFLFLLFCFWLYFLFLSFCFFFSSVSSSCTSFSFYPFPVCTSSSSFSFYSNFLPPHSSNRGFFECSTHPVWFPHTHWWSNESMKFNFLNRRNDWVGGWGGGDYYSSLSLTPH